MPNKEEEKKSRSFRPNQTNKKKKDYRRAGSTNLIMCSPFPYWPSAMDQEKSKRCANMDLLFQMPVS